MIVEPSVGWIEGVFIVVGLVLSIMISACIDFNKDKKFVQLQSLNREEDVPVLRGKHGSMQTISAWKLVVGDIIALKPGDKVPADCLVIDSANLKVNEPTCIKREDDKEDGAPELFEWRELVKTANDSPFLFADSFLTAGTCRAVVCCVGANSTRGIKDKKHEVTEQTTELSTKLGNIAGSIKFLALIFSIVILATALIVLFIQKGVDSDLEGGAFTKKLCDAFIIALIMLVVSIPEGLPLTADISIAYSVLQMYEDDNVLVRDLQSVEQVGLITDLCLGKTGTMTTEEMEVVNFYTQNIFVLNSRKNTLFNCDLDDTIIDKIVESIVFNSSAYIEMTENSFYVPVGNGTEVSLIKWLQQAEVPVHEVLKKKQAAGVVLAEVPFNSKLKRSIIAVKHPDLEDTVRIYVKGAPEVVVPNCENYFQSQRAVKDDGDEYYTASKVPLDPNEKARILEEEMKHRITRNGLRAIAFSYCDMNLAAFQQVMASIQGDVDEDSEIAGLERNQTLLCLIGLKDPIRQNIQQVVQNAAETRLNVRLISGDNIDTTVAVARDCGVLTQDQYQAYLTGDSQVAMHASDFRKICGDVQKVANEQENEGEEISYSYYLNQENQRQFNQIIGSLKVIGRAEPYDKLLLVAGLRGIREFEDDEKQQHRVAVVGEGINDIQAFEAADVSFAVQDGTSVARNKASMILRTNDFDSCMRAVMWGRNIYMNVQRFLQFQITCNLAVIVVVMVSTITMTESVLNAIMLIYINLIMDNLGALALASTKPTTDIAQYEAGNGNIINGYMYRQIFGIMAFMTGIMMIVMYAGKSIFGDLSYSASDQTTENDDKAEHFTLIWNTFIFLQFFNMINCRDVSPTKMHGFSGLLRNKMTIFILLLIIAVQATSCFTFLGYPVFEAHKVSTRYFFICVVTASSVLLANALLKFLPSSWFAKVALNEDKSIGGGSKLMSAYDNQAKKPAFGKGGAAAKPVPVSDDEEQLDRSQDEEDGYHNVR